MNRTGRQPRTHIPNTIHHVMARGNNRQKIFYGREYFLRYLDLLNESTGKFDHKIIAYCLMGNHVHLIIHIHASPLSLIIKNINGRYARWLNHKRKQIGHVFQGRYRSFEVQNDEYLVNLCRYIHFNPVAAKMVANLDDYFWSSHQYYTISTPPAWMSTVQMHAAIKNKTGLNYHDFMYQPVDRETWNPAIYISDTDEIIFNEDTIRKENEKNIDEKIMPTLLSKEEVSAIVCNYLHTPEAELLEPSRNRKRSKQRILLANYLLQFSGTKVTHIAKFITVQASNVVTTICAVKHSSR